MQAEALVQINALMNVVITALAATFIAVGDAEWHAIVASRDHSLILRDDSSIATLHAV